MSIRDYFKHTKVLTQKTLSDVTSTIETPEYVSEIIAERNKYIPSVDYSDLNNFCQYGSAEMYYADAFNHILRTYPYDGSLKEKLIWKNNNLDFDNYVFENIYPKHVGYLNFNFGETTTGGPAGYTKSSQPSYIYFNGFMNTGSFEHNSQATMQNSSSGFEYSNKAGNERDINIKINPLVGNTIEFWFKSGPQQPSTYSYIIDVWNNVTPPDANYERLSIEIGGDTVSGPMEFFITCMQGLSGVNRESIGTVLTPSEWHHYAITYVSDGADLLTKLYQDGELIQESVIVGTSFTEFLGEKHCYIGTKADDLGCGQLSGSMDDFRFWKAPRSHQEISRFYFTDIGGGTNTDDANLDLGVYYKFNEGISSLNSLDQYCIDYSGRTSNGKIINYGNNTITRTVDETPLSDESYDPVIWKSSQEVTDLINYYSFLGRSYDETNNNSLLSYFPSFMIEEDQGELVKLCQIMAAYLDTLLIQIKNLNRLKNIEYSNTSVPFSDRMLMHQGSIAPELFSDISDLESIFNRNESDIFEEKVFKVKNIIYKNIYNNIVNIYKSKGTDQSFRNVIKCFGIDENLLKIRHYSDNERFELKDRYSLIGEAKPVVDFSDVDNQAGIVYSDNPLTPDTDITSGYTFEFEAHFPKKQDLVSSFMVNDYGFLQSSIGGVWSDGFDLRIYAVRDELRSDSCKFVLESDGLAFSLETGYFQDVYDNNRIILGFKTYPEKTYEFLTDGAEDTDLIIEFFGKSNVNDNENLNFSLTQSVTNISTAQIDMFASDRFVYAGAYYNELSGTLETMSDIRIGAIRAYQEKLSDEVLKTHLRDSRNFGSNDILNDKIIINIEFDNFTQTDGSGEFTVQDISGNNNGFTGYNFLPDSSKAVTPIYFETLKQKNFDDIYGEDMIKILEQDSERFGFGFSPSSHLISFEKSLNASISERMLQELGSIKEYARLCFNGPSKYISSYNNLKEARKLFFQNVQSNPDQEKFYELYKWIDGAVSKMLMSFVPASAVMYDDISNVIESHAFERNKYWIKPPTLEFKVN